MTPEKIKHHQQNAEALRVCFNILQQVMKEYQDKWSGRNHCDAFSLAVAAKIIYERWEVEKRALPPENLPSVDFCPPTPPPLPTIPPGRSSEVAQAITSSIYYKVFYGHLLPKN